MTKIGVIGAGMSGLVAARRLAEAGHDVVVYDKGRRPGGRIATRALLGGAYADHGAQFFTARSDAFTAQVAQWEAEGLVHVWCRGFSANDGHPRYATLGGMSRLGAALSDGLHVRSSVAIDQVEATPDGFELHWPTTTRQAEGSDAVDVLVCTAPLPQSALLVGHLIDVPDILYSPTLSLLVALDADPRVRFPGGVQLADDPTWSWVADNAAKGTSAHPALTLHTTTAVARQRMADPPEDVEADLLALAQPWIGTARVLDTSLHRWRYATPMEIEPSPFAVSDNERLWLAGDAFAGPRVEGAYLSGLAVADALR